MACPECGAIPSDARRGCASCALGKIDDREATQPSVRRASIRPDGPSKSLDAECNARTIENEPPVPQEEAESLPVGRLVAGRYEVLGLLAVGGMGRVYRARHRGLDRVVCLKILRPTFESDPTTVGRFEREARAASRLDHPNCVRLLDFGADDDGLLYLAMELVPGRDLRTVLRDDGPFEEARACHVGAELLAALAEAHANGVVHRDLKPENIMLCEKGGSESVKVLDFGIARILDAGLPAITVADRICGTPLYMSPEQATGGEVGPASDLYAVGVVLYQLVTGALPFYSQNTIEVLTRHVNERPMPPRLVAPDRAISEGLERLILRAMAKLPAERPSSAEQFRAELVALAKHLRPTVMAPPAAPELNRPVPRAVLERALEPLLPAPALPPGPAPVPSPRRPVPTPSLRRGLWLVGAAVLVTLAWWLAR